MTKPNSTLYLDDPEEGLSRDTSPPRFVQLAADDFYYNGSDDFSPFGSDDAHDTLSALQDWYRTPSGKRSGHPAAQPPVVLAWEHDTFQA